MPVIALRSSIARRPALGAALALGVAMLADAPARADEKTVCVNAYVQAQRLRQDGKLRAAREQMLVCARDVCPAMLTHDCTQWVSEVDQTLPSVVIEARGPDGHDAIDVTVTVDGQPFISKIDGKAVPLDPGVHTFHYEMEGASPIEERVVIREGDKNRHLAVTFAPPASAANPTANVTPKTTPEGGESEPKERPIPLLVYVFAGSAVAAGAVFTYAAVKVNGQVSDWDASGCKGTAAGCPDVDSAKTTKLVGEVALGLGVASLATAAVLFFTRPAVKANRSAAPKAGARGFDVHPVVGGAFANMTARF